MGAVIRSYVGRGATGAGHDPVGVEREHAQPLVLGEGELDRASGHAYLTAGVVDGELLATVEPPSRRWRP